MRLTSTRRSTKSIEDQRGASVSRETWQSRNDKAIAASGGRSETFVGDDAEVEEVQVTRRCSRTRRSDV